MTKRFFVNVTGEPATLYDDDAKYFAVHMAPDTREAGDPAAGEALISEFLGKARDVRFFMATYTSAGVSDLQEIAQYPVQGETPDLMAWLGQRAPQDDSDLSEAENQRRTKAFWIGQTIPENGDGAAQQEMKLTDTSVVAAMDLLRGSLNWNAPVPQKAGLLHLVSHPSEDGATDLRLIFPWWGEELPKPENIDVTWYGVDATVELIDPTSIGTEKKDNAIQIAIDDLVFVTRFLDPFPDIEGYGNDGWITPAENSSDTIRLLRKVRTELTGTLAPLPALSALDFDDTAERLIEGTPKSTLPNRSDAREGAKAQMAAFSDWMSKSACLMLFDPFDISFHIAGEEPKGRLWDTLIEAVEAAKLEMGDALPGDLRAPDTWLPSRLDYDFDDLRLSTGVITEAELAETESDAKPVDLETALLTVNEVATELSDPDTLLKVVVDYLTKGFGDRAWTAPLTLTGDEAPGDVQSFADKARDKFRDYFTEASGNLPADLRLDTADYLMSEFQTVLGKPGQKDDIGTALDSYFWMRRRITREAPFLDHGGYDALRPLPMPEKELLDAITFALEAIHALAVDDILNPDFTPDLEPQPLNIIAANGLSPHTLDEIGTHTTGIGLVIAAKHPSEDDAKLLDRVAHANAANYTLLNSEAEHGPVLEPSTLTDNYGQVEISVPYAGVPEIGRMVAQKTTAESAGLSSLQPYTLAHADYGEKNGGFRAPSPLAYGYEVHALPFFVSNYGTMPKDLRSAAEVFTPATPRSLPPDPSADMYLRRTPVATVPVSDAPKSEHRGLGYVPEDVIPISPDLLTASSIAHKPQDPALLLMGYNDPGANGLKWLPGLDKPAVLDFSPPRVGFEDFDRWVANPQLRNALGAHSEHTPTIEGETNTDFANVLDAISNARDFMEQVGITEDVELVNHLPDPAVHALEVQVEVFDSLRGEKPATRESQIVHVQPYKGLTVPIEPEDYEESETGPEYVQYKEFLGQIMQAVSYQLEIRVNGPDSVGRQLSQSTNGQLMLELRPGDMCLVTVSPLVAKSHYEAGHRLRAISDKFAPQASTDGSFTDASFNWRLRGTPVLVEAMDVPKQNAIVTVGPKGSADIDVTEPENFDATPALEAMQVKPDGIDRGFTYQLQPNFESAIAPQGIYRAFAEADLITHRWRTTGQPIYNWISPSNTAEDPLNPGEGKPGPVRAVKFAQDVQNFENDAFYGRQIFDGERRRIRLPAFLPREPAATEAPQENQVILDRVNWPSPAANYWRYSVEFRSRYNGALISNHGVVPIINRTATAQGDSQGTQVSTPWMFADRVAILADISGATVTAPQLRHILPSLSVEHGADGPLPYVASLNERPFDQFGLADRLVAEVQKVRNFALNDQSTEARLAFDSYRNEVGPEPRTSLTGVDDTASRAVTVRTEGPVGHHFDPATADAPGFVNSSYLLHLDGLEDDWDDQQMFAALQMRRLVDPGWTYTSPEIDAASQSIWLIDFDDDALGLGEGDELKIKHLATSKQLEDNQDATALCAVTVGTNLDGFTFAIDPRAAYEDPNVEDDSPRQFCQVNSRTHRVSLVYRALGEEGHEIVVLRQRREASRDGDRGTNGLDAPQIAGSARYKAGALTDIQINDDDSVDKRNCAKPVLMGSAPSTIWAKSGYNMSRFCLGRSIVPLYEARPQINGPALSFTDRQGAPRRLSSRDALNNTPLGVQTHLAALTLRQSENAGRTVLLPQETVLLNPIGQATLARPDAVTNLSLLAFESPAEVIELPTGNAKREATFDLKAVTPGTHILLRCRIANMPASVTGADLEIAGARFRLDGPELSRLAALDIRVPVGSGPLMVQAYGTSETGETLNSLVSGSLNSRNILGDHVTLAVSNAPGLALDVSMLPQIQPTGEAWSWDWVFPSVATDSTTTSGAEPPLMETATSAESLQSQKEAVLVPLGATTPIKVAQS